MEQGHIRLQAGNHTTGQISTDLGGMDDADIIDVGKLLRAIWARKFLIALGVILGMVIGWFYAEQVASPVYRAKSVLLLDPQAQTLAGLVSASEGISGMS